MAVFKKTVSLPLRLQTSATYMLVSTIAPSDRLAGLGRSLSTRVHYQSSPEQLVQDTLRLKEGVLNDTGALVISTGEFTGRTPKDRFIVKDHLTADTVNWNEVNTPLGEDHFEAVCVNMRAWLGRLPELWVRDCYACADEKYRLPIRVVSERPWSNQFAYNMFLRPAISELKSFDPEWQVFVAPGLRLDPAECGTRRANASVISFKHKMILIAGTGYTGEVKKGIFSVLNYIFPEERGVLSMHCAANMGESGDTALFFGLSGTGKTTLSADPSRMLIGDDEHGWANDKIFNFEGGCYAKAIHLNKDMEPEIYAAVRSGALVENTVFFPGTDRIDFDSSCVTENTRVSYPIEFIRNAKIPSVGNIPSHIFFLTCDAYGVLPPISRLTPAQAMYQFISGYTAKIAGTEAGITEPVSTFSACFGAPFLPLHPAKYACMLGEKLRRHKVSPWLVNTGWTGGAYGSGSRISLKYTRSIIRAALSGALNKVHYDRHPVFGIDVPSSCPDVPSNILYPKDTWGYKEAYDEQAAILARKFISNFEKYANEVSADIRSAGPLVC
jgi:phosphoenolpyruvate carboxykinase (ATP)